MPQPPDPRAVAVTVRLCRVEYEALALIARDGGMPLDEVLVCLMRAGFEAMAQRTGITAGALAQSARGRR